MPEDRPIELRADTVIGHATTVGQALPLGVDDPVIAARAVRRALADAHRRADDVEALAVATPSPLTLEAAVRFARRALGPHGETVRCAIATADADASALTELAVAALSDSPADGGLAIAVGIDRDGMTSALCVRLPIGRPRP